MDEWFDFTLKVNIDSLFCSSVDFVQEVQETSLKMENKATTEILKSTRPSILKEEV